jgi:DNA-binding NtrC family response regulator
MTIGTILILCTTDMQAVANELMGLLNPGPYRVRVQTEPISGWGPALSSRPDLVIPLLIGQPESSEQIVTDLCSFHPISLMLPVINASALQDAIASKALEVPDFLVPPFREHEVRARVQRVLPINKEQQIVRVKEVVTQALGLEMLVGQDPKLVEFKRKLTLVAHVESPVLLTGETGTGKELCARALHYLSMRTSKPFLPVNCGAIPVDLFESEMFGRRKGAFTGAGATQQGLVANAEGGTLFLDEIETLHREAQAKLLRFIQDGTYYPIGSPVQLQADVRIISATNMDLHEMVKEGTFRKDLLYRLAVMSLPLPALRDRLADIPLLVEHFLAQHARRHGKDRLLSPQALDALSHYTWPGNIRELENVILQASVMADGSMIDIKDLPIPVNEIEPNVGPLTSFKQAKAAAVAQFEKAYLVRLLHMTEGNVSQAARIAQKERRALGRLLKKHQIKSFVSSQG